MKEDPDPVARFKDLSPRQSADFRQPELQYAGAGGAWAVVIVAWLIFGLMALGAIRLVRLIFS